MACDTKLIKRGAVLVRGHHYLRVVSVSPTTGKLTAQERHGERGRFTEEPVELELVATAKNYRRCGACPFPEQVASQKKRQKPRISLRAEPKRIAQGPRPPELPAPPQSGEED